MTGEKSTSDKIRSYVQEVTFPIFYRLVFPNKARSITKRGRSFLTKKESDKDSYSGRLLQRQAACFLLRTLQGVFTRDLCDFLYRHISDEDPAFFFVFVAVLQSCTRNPHTSARWNVADQNYLQLRRVRKPPTTKKMNLPTK